MKKVLALVIVGSFILTSCSYYSCPTYTKKAPEKNTKEAAI
jgi:hypothetical protein